MPASHDSASSGQKRKHLSDCVKVHHLWTAGLSVWMLDISLPFFSYLYLSLSLSSFHLKVKSLHLPFPFGPNTHRRSWVMSRPPWHQIVVFEEHVSWARICWSSILSTHVNVKSADWLLHAPAIMPAWLAAHIAQATQSDAQVHPQMLTRMGVGSKPSYCSEHPKSLTSGWLVILDRYPIGSDPWPHHSPHGLLYSTFLCCWGSHFL